MLKQLTTLTFAIGIYTSSFSQINYGVKVGIVESSIKESHSLPGTKFRPRQGFQIGATLDFLLKKNLTLRTALQLTQKGFEAVAGDPGGPTYLYRKANSTYVELPIEVAYNIRLAKSSKLFIGAGPVLSAGVQGRGKIIFREAYDTQTWELTFKPFLTNPGCKIVDLGAIFLMGTQFKRMAVCINYNSGLINSFNDGNNLTQKNRSLALSIGYLVRK